jgi:hypothetical protein
MDLWQGRSELQEISKRIYITNFFGAKNKKKLQKSKITHVLIAGKIRDCIFSRFLA